jgi:hypothetical protein
MKSVTKALTLCAALAAATPAFAAPIVLYNTGVDGSGTPLANGAIDTHYSTDAKTPGSPFVYSNSAYVNVSDAKFIAIQADGGYTKSTNIFAQSFFLSDITSAMVSGFFATDNSGSVSLNGISGATSGSYTSLTPFSFTSGFVVGLNTLNFTLQDSGPPSAILVSGITGSAGGVGAVPEPATWGMMILGFGAVGGVLRRRRNKVAVRVTYA